ncbi:MAG: tetratricopeptide repeat protein [Candidatus Eremiobacteraeota bacterium]|nr:tetratricopeptide repeat protein [Candidatus Eremiobacteraeota bacterium]
MLSSWRWLGLGLAWMFSLSNLQQSPVVFPEPALRTLVEDSYRPVGGRPEAFFGWLEGAYQRFRSPHEPATLALRLAAFEQRVRGCHTLAERAAAERDASFWAHGFVKKALPRFSLQRGFEFRNAEQLGERQCLLQSILISSMLHSAGVRSGLAMVYRNEQGGESNNGHVVALVQASNGQDFLVDASHLEPLVRHQGLMVRSERGLCFVQPLYAPAGQAIVGYRTLEGRTVPNVQPLDHRFALSQVNFYRGERTPGGLMEGALSPQGLQRSAEYFETSLQQAADNPLPLYSLGRVYERLGNREKAHDYFERAERLYRHHGWVPLTVVQARQRTDAATSQRLKVSG